MCKNHPSCGISYTDWKFLRSWSIFRIIWIWQWVGGQFSCKLISTRFAIICKTFPLRQRMLDTPFRVDCPATSDWDISFGLNGFVVLNETQKFGVILSCIEDDRYKSTGKTHFSVDIKVYSTSHPRISNLDDVISKKHDFLHFTSFNCGLPK